MLGTVAHPEGITNPPIDDLLEKVDSKYGLVIDAAKRARQINTYAQQLESNQLEVFGPLVEVSSDEKPWDAAHCCGRFRLHLCL